MLALPILLTTALSMIGFAYAHWSESIFINGTVNMGSLTVVFSTYEPPMCWDKDDLTKDVAETTCWYDNLVTDPHTSKEGYTKMWVVISNGYPSYWVHCTFILQNIGTIPAMIDSLVFSDPEGKLTWVSVTSNSGYFVDGAGKPIINIEVVNNVPYQLDPCSKNKMEIDIDLKQDALECHTYHFEVGIVYEQWN